MGCASVVPFQTIHASIFEPELQSTISVPLPCFDIYLILGLLINRHSCPNLLFPLGQPCPLQQQHYERQREVEVRTLLPR